MKLQLPWARAPQASPQQVIYDADRERREAEYAEREAAFQAEMKERAERMARIPEDLEGYRLSRGCSCGADEERRRVDPHMINSAGSFHDQNCEARRALFVQVIET